MITRHSSRENPLDESFLNQKLQNAQCYDRIAGYFRSSIFEVAGEALESVSGCIRVIYNSDLDPLDVSTAKAAQQTMRKSWCAGQPELLPKANRERFFRKLYDYLISGKLQVRVLPDTTFGFVHGKAGVITLADGSKTSFLGSINESLTAWKLNYELLWEDDSSDAVNWIQHEFDTLWNHHHAVPLNDFVIADTKRIAERETVSTFQWQDELMELLDMPSAIWTGKNWIDEQGIVWPATGPESITKCPRKLGIISQCLISSGSNVADLLLRLQYECVIVDEAHRSRRRKVKDKSVEEKAEPNNLMAFLLKMSMKTRSMLLATATPVQLHPIEAFALLSVLAQGNDQVLGDAWSPWRNAENTVPLVMGETSFLKSEALALEWIRNPLPHERKHASFKLLCRRLGLKPSDYIASAESYNQFFWHQ